LTKSFAGCGGYQHTAQLSSAPKAIAEVDAVKQLEDLSLGKGLDCGLTLAA